MNRGALSQDVMVAESLKISILRLYGLREDGADVLSTEDWAYGEDALVLVLGRLNTEASRMAFVDLLDFELDDTVWDAIGEILNEFGGSLLPVLKARIGQPPCKEALRQKPYCKPMPPQLRDKQIKNILMDLGV